MIEYTLDGTRIGSVEDFYHEVSRVLIPGASWGHNLDAFNDILTGGFGTPLEGFIVRWTHSEASEQRMGLAIFEQLIEILHRHGPGGEEADSNVHLILE